MTPVARQKCGFAVDSFGDGRARCRSSISLMPSGRRSKDSATSLLSLSSRCAHSARQDLWTAENGRRSIRGRPVRSAQHLHSQALGRFGVEGDDSRLAIGSQADDQAVVQIDAALRIAL